MQEIMNVFKLLMYSGCRVVTCSNIEIKYQVCIGISTICNYSSLGLGWIYGPDNLIRLGQKKIVLRSVLNPFSIGSSNVQEVVTNKVTT